MASPGRGFLKDEQMPETTFNTTVFLEEPCGDKLRGSRAPAAVHSRMTVFAHLGSLALPSSFEECYSFSFAAQGDMDGNTRQSPPGWPQAASTTTRARTRHRVKAFAGDTLTLARLSLPVPPQSRSIGLVPGVSATRLGFPSFSQSGKTHALSQVSKTVQVCSPESAVGLRSSRLHSCLRGPRPRVTGTRTL